MLMQAFLIAASAGALVMAARAGSPTSESELALGDAPSIDGARIKLQVFYAGLLLTAAVSVMSADDLPIYLVGVLIFAGTPVLGHQTVGLIPARLHSRPHRVLWRLGLVYPLLVLVLGVTMIVQRLG